VFPNGSVQSCAAAAVLDFPTYAWSQTPGGSLSATSGQVISLSPMPFDVLAIGNYVYISGGTGTAEAIPITNVGASSITVTCAHTHTGAWTVGSASSGLQEAIEYSYQSASWIPIHIPANGGTPYPIYAPVNVKFPIHLFGDSAWCSILQAQGNIGVIDHVSGNGAVYENFSIQATSQQTAGFGIRLGNAGAEINFTQISRVYCNLLYDGIIAVNADNWGVKHCVIYEFTHSGITVGSTLSPDDFGCDIEGCIILNWGLGTPAAAGVLITSTTANVTGGWIGGTGDNQMNYAVYSNTVASTAGGLTISNVQIQTCMIAMIYVGGTNYGISIAGNEMQCGTGLAGSGIVIANGVGTGCCQGTINGNVITGTIGAAWVGVSISGGASGWTIDGNSFANMPTGISLSGTGSVTLGPNNFSNVTAPISNTGSGSDWSSVSLQNSWGSQGAGYNNFGFRIEGARLFFRGLIGGGTYTAGTTVWTLPAGYRPAGNCFILALGEGIYGTAMAMAMLNINATTGAVTIAASTLSVSAGNLSLEGLSVPLT